MQCHGRFAYHRADPYIWFAYHPANLLQVDLHIRIDHGMGKTCMTTSVLSPAEFTEFQNEWPQIHLSGYTAAGQCKLGVHRLEIRNEGLVVTVPHQVHHEATSSREAAAQPRLTVEHNVDNNIFVKCCVPLVLLHAFVEFMLNLGH